MTLRHMKIFVAVYQNSSITKASEQLHIVQPSVSLAIKELENYYGICLFDRIGRRIYPTVSGTKFYDYALHIVSLFDEMEQKVRNWDALGAIRVGASITIGNYLLPGIIREFKRQYPDIQVTVAIRNAETVERYVMDNKVDFALTEGEPQYEQLHQEHLLQDRFCLIVHPDHPLAHMGHVELKDLLDYPFLLREKGSASREMVESLFRARNHSLTSSWESASTQALVRGVANNLGISIIPSFLAQKDIENGIVVEVPIPDLKLYRHLSIIYHQNKYLSQSAKAFLDLCRQFSEDNTHLGKLLS